MTHKHNKSVKTGLISVQMQYACGPGVHVVLIPFFYTIIMLKSKTRREGFFNFEKSLGVHVLLINFDCLFVLVGDS
jgi:hypothetical protein